MRLHESFRVENAALVDAHHHNREVAQAQLDILTLHEELAAAAETGKDVVVGDLIRRLDDLVRHRNALLASYFDRAELEEADRETASEALRKWTPKVN